eukprot:3191677-Ditylum_brightwellii.AAC.1
MEHSKANNMPSYVDYHRYFGGKGIRSFADLPHNDHTKKILRKIYDTVDDIEFYTGTLSEDQFLSGDQRSLNNPSVHTTMILSNVIPNFVAVSCYKDPHLYSVDFLTEAGLKMITEPNDAFVTLLQHHFRLDDNTPFSRFKKNETVYQEPVVTTVLIYVTLMSICSPSIKRYAKNMAYKTSDVAMSAGDM